MSRKWSAKRRKRFARTIQARTFNKKVQADAKQQLADWGKQLQRDELVRALDPISIKAKGDLMRARSSLGTKLDATIATIEGHRSTIEHQRVQLAGALGVLKSLIREARRSRR